MTTIVSREEIAVKIPPPIRGMNTTDAPHHLPEGQGIEAFNVEIDEILGVNKRKGFTPFNTASALLPRSNTGTIKEITGAMVYGSGTTWTGSICKGSDVLFIRGNSSAIYWQIATNVGTATLSLAVAYSQTVTASSYILGPKEIGALYDYKYGTTQRLLAFAGSEGFQATAGATGSFASISAGGLTDYANVRGVTFQDVFYFCNGYEFKSYDGSSVSSVSGSPAPSDPKYIGVYTIGNANFLWIGGSNTNASKSYFAFSDVNSGSTWPAANRYYAGDRDGTVIMGGAPIPGGWVIFKENSIYVFSGIPGSGVLRRVIDNLGCAAENTISAYEGRVYFVGRRSGKLGVYMFDGTPNVICLSDSVETTLNTLKLADVNEFSAAIYENKYYLGARTSSVSLNDQHFICYLDRPFSYLNNLLFPWVRGDRRWNALAVQNISGTNYLFSGSATNGLVYQEDTGNSDDATDNIAGNTTAINAYVDTAWLDFGDHSRKKELLRAYVDATESGEWMLKLRLYRDFQTYGFSEHQIDLGSTTMKWSDVIFLITPWQTAVDKGVQEVLFNYPCMAKFFRFRWANANAGEPFTAYPMTVFLKLENR